MFNNLAINLNEMDEKQVDRMSMSWMIPKRTAGGSCDDIAVTSDLQSVLKQVLRKPLDRAVIIVQRRARASATSGDDTFLSILESW